MPDGPTLRFEKSATNSVLLATIRLAAEGVFDATDGGAWYFKATQMLAELEQDLIALANQSRQSADIDTHVSVLRIAGNLADRVDRPTGLDVAGLFVRPSTRGDQHRAKFVNDMQAMRRNALEILRQN